MQFFVTYSFDKRKNKGKIDNRINERLTTWAFDRLSADKKFPRLIKTGYTGGRTQARIHVPPVLRQTISLAGKSYPPEQGNLLVSGSAPLYPERKNETTGFSRNSTHRYIDI